MLAIIRFALLYLIKIIELAMLARALMSWFVDPYNRIYQVLCRLTEPVISPVRRIYSKFTTSVNIPLDIPFLLTFLLLEIVTGVIYRL